MRGAFVVPVAEMIAVLNPFAACSKIARIFSASASASAGGKFSSGRLEMTAPTDSIGSWHSRSRTSRCHASPVMMWARENAGGAGAPAWIIFNGHQPLLAQACSMSAW